MAGYALRTEGLRELSRTFRHMEGDTKKFMRATLKDIGTPFAAAATSEEQSEFTGDLAGFVSKLGRGMMVEVRRRRSTGQRGDFGSLLMRKVLLPLQREREEETVEAVGKAFDRFADRYGF